jgi:hypothetical protein
MANAAKLFGMELESFKLFEWFFSRFVVPCIFNYSNKTPNQMQKSIVKFIALSYRRCSTCFVHYYAHHQEPFKLPLQPLVSLWMWRWTCFLTNRPRLEKTLMPETGWAASIQQINKFYNWLLHLLVVSFECLHGISVFMRYTCISR